LQIKTKIVSIHTADSKPVKQEVNGTVILPPLVFPGKCITRIELLQGQKTCSRCYLKFVVISRYFYLIVFAMYIREVGPKEFPVTFKQWMEDKGDLVAMIAEGRSKLEWERKIPDEKLVMHSHHFILFVTD
jgi:hypothetical protein